jgi:glutamate-1-semialdehyde 2,1-aminomutase/spore coat polysaccharide biosynthesis protein SpsF
MTNVKAKDLLERALEVTPRATQTMSKGYQMWCLDDDFPIFIESGKGCRMKSVDGQDFIDTMCALGPSILGYCNKEVDAAIKKQLSRGIIFSLPSPLEVELGELLCEIIPCCEKVRYCKNGSDAVSGAIRAARSYTGKDHILCFRGGYNGWSDSIACASQRPYGIPETLAQFVDFFEYNNLQSLEEKLETGKFACVLMEPVSLEVPKKGFLESVRNLCNKYKVVLIFDEMITGFRWSLGGAQEYYGVTPDLACFGKAVSNGMPLAFICGKNEYMKEFEHVFFSATYFGEALSLAAAVATIKEMKSKNGRIHKHIWRQGERIKQKFLECCKKFEVDAEVLGAVTRINFKFNHKDEVGVRDLFHKEMIKRGVFIGIQVYATWATKKRDINTVLSAMEESLEIVGAAIKEDKLDEYLDGQRSMVIFKR